MRGRDVVANYWQRRPRMCQERSARPPACVERPPCANIVVEPALSAVQPRVRRSRAPCANIVVEPALSAERPRVA